MPLWLREKERISKLEDEIQVAKALSTGVLLKVNEILGVARAIDSRFKAYAEGRQLRLSPIIFDSMMKEKIAPTESHLLLLKPAGREAVQDLSFGIHQFEQARQSMKMLADQAANGNVVTDDMIELLHPLFLESIDHLNKARDGIKSFLGLN